MDWGRRDEGDGRAECIERRRGKIKGATAKAEWIRQHAGRSGRGSTVQPIVALRSENSLPLTRRAVDTARGLRTATHQSAINTRPASAGFSDYMDDNAPKENPPADFNKLDLNQLQGFSFGTQWTQEKASPSDRRERDSGADRPRRDDRRDGPGGGAPMNRDRRAFRKPAGPGGPSEGAPSAPAGPGGGAPERREYSGGGGPRRDGPGG